MLATIALGSASMQLEPNLPAILKLLRRSGQLVVRLRVYLLHINANACEGDFHSDSVWPRCFVKKRTEKILWSLQKEKSPEPNIFVYIFTYIFTLSGIALGSGFGSRIGYISVHTRYCNF